jgi:hypothetical protein
VPVAGSPGGVDVTGLAVVYLEADDLGAAFKVIGVCGEPFDR